MISLEKAIAGILAVTLVNGLLRIETLKVELKNFISRVEKVAGVTVSLVSYGPARNQTFKI